MAKVIDIRYPKETLKDYIIKKIKTKEFVSVVVNNKFTIVNSLRYSVKANNHWIYIEEFEYLPIDKVICKGNRIGCFEHKIYVTCKSLEDIVLQDENTWYEGKKIFLSSSKNLRREII